MKMLNAIDDAKLPDGRTPTPPAPRRWASCCACCTRWCRVTWHLWQDLGYAKELGDLLDAPGRTWTKPR